MLAAALSIPLSRSQPDRDRRGRIEAAIGSLLSASSRSVSARYCESLPGLVHSSLLPACSYQSAYVDSSPWRVAPVLLSHCPSSRYSAHRIAEIAKFTSFDDQVVRRPHEVRFEQFGLNANMLDESGHASRRPLLELINLHISPVSALALPRSRPERSSVVSIETRQRRQFTPRKNISRQCRSCTSPFD